MHCSQQLAGCWLTDVELTSDFACDAEWSGGLLQVRSWLDGYVYGGSVSTDGDGVRETCSIEHISWLQGKNPILSPPQCYINIPPKPWVDRGWNHDIRDPILKGVLNIGGMGCARPCSSDYQNPKSTARHVDHRPFVARMHKSSLIKPPSCLPRGWRQVISDYLFSSVHPSIERLKSVRRAYKRPVLKPKAAPDPVSQTLAALKDGPAAENWLCWRYSWGTVRSMETNGIAWYSDDILPSKKLTIWFTLLAKRRRLWTRSPWCLDPAWLLCCETFVVLTLFVKSFGEGFQDLSSIGFPVCKGW